MIQNIRRFFGFKKKTNVKFTGGSSLSYKAGFNPTQGKLAFGLVQERYFSEQPNNALKDINLNLFGDVRYIFKPSNQIGDCNAAVEVGINTESTFEGYLFLGKEINKTYIERISLGIGYAFTPKRFQHPALEKSSYDFKFGGQGAQAQVGKVILEAARNRSDFQKIFDTLSKAEFKDDHFVIKKSEAKDISSWKDDAVKKLGLFDDAKSLVTEKIANTTGEKVESVISKIKGNPSTSSNQNVPKDLQGVLKLGSNDSLVKNHKKDLAAIERDFGKISGVDTIKNKVDAFTLIKDFDFDDLTKENISKMMNSTFFRTECFEDISSNKDGSDFILLPHHLPQFKSFVAAVKNINDRIAASSNQNVPQTSTPSSDPCCLVIDNGSEEEWEKVEFAEDLDRAKSVVAIAKYFRGGEEDEKLLGKKISKMIEEKVKDSKNDLDERILLNQLQTRSIPVLVAIRGDFKLPQKAFGKELFVTVKLNSNLEIFVAPSVTITETVF